MAKGFVCPKCSSTRIATVQTWRLDGAIQRRRKCYTCFATFKTYEVIADMIPIEPEFDFLFRKALAK